MPKLAFMMTIAVLLALSLGGAALAQEGGEGTEVQALVVPDELYVRAAPSPNGELLGSFLRDTRLRLSGRDNFGGWVYGTPVDGGLTGWVSSSYLAFAEGVNLFTLPIMDAPGQPAAPNAAPATSPAPVSQAAPPALSSSGGATTSTVNFRTGPGLNFTILRTLAPGVAVSFNGRNATGTWFRGVVNGEEGWLFYSLVRVPDAAALPIVAGSSPGSQAPAAGGTNAPAGPANVPAPGGIYTAGSSSRAIFQSGQAQGNRRDVFSKVGDSMTASSYFLTPVGTGGLRLGDYAYLQPVVDFFSQTSARTHNSFANSSIAAQAGWTSGDLLDPARSPAGLCNAGESPLACEYRLTKPALALIMIGTNDLGRVPAEQFRANLQSIVQTSISMGVIPVLSTLPDHMHAPGSGEVGTFNSIIRQTALGNGVPLWDYWAAMQPLPDRGISIDGTHPSTPLTGEAAVFAPDTLLAGYNVRNLSALQVLYALWQQVLAP